MSRLTQYFPPDQIWRMVEGPVGVCRECGAVVMTVGINNHIQWHEDLKNEIHDLEEA